MSVARPDDRDRGRIEERGGSLRVVVYAGLDPVNGRRVYLRETIAGTTKAAHKRAKTALNKLLSQVAEQRSVNSSVTLGYAVDEWMRTNELEDSTRKTYEGYIERTIRPVVGATASALVSVLVSASPDGRPPQHQRAFADPPSARHRRHGRRA
jgi:hypothetical protein